MNNSAKMPFINIRGMVAFPHAEVSLFIGRPKSVAAINLAISDYDSHLILISQKKAENNEPSAPDDMFKIGTKVKVRNHVTLDGAMKIYCEGIARVAIESIYTSGPANLASVTPFPYRNDDSELSETDLQEILRLLDSWRPNLQSKSAPPTPNLHKARSTQEFVEGVLNAIGHFNTDKNGPDKDILAAAKTGLGQAYQQSFDTNKDAINLFVAKRQEILASDTYTSQAMLIKDLLKNEVELFSAANRHTD